MNTNVELVKSFRVGQLQVKVCYNRVDLGIASGQDIIRKIKELLSKQEEIRVVFASAPSQKDTIHFLRTIADIDWSRVVVFNMDEYIGLARDTPGSFGQYLNHNLFEKVKPKEVHLIDGMNDPAKECERFASLLLKSPIDIILLGIGENGHIAFNEPDIADFNDKAIVKIVDLDEKSRMQQVHDKCFKSIHDVPRQALTITIPVFFSAKYLFCMAPGKNKKDAVRKVLTGPITSRVPGTVLRNHLDCILYLDNLSNGY